MKKLIFLLIVFFVPSLCSALVLSPVCSGVAASGSGCSGDYGYTTAGSTSYNSGAGTIYCTRIALSCSGTVSSMSAVQEYANGPSYQFEFSLYSDNGSGTDPSTLLGHYGATYSNAYPSFSVDSSIGEVITGDPSYVWGCLQFQVNNDRLYFDSGGVSRIYDGTWGSPPATWPTATDTESTNNYSIYLTF